MSDLIDGYQKSGFIPTKRDDIYCPQCGDPTEELHEGYCEGCCEQNQMELDMHNAEYGRWNRMTNERREEAIKRGYS